MTTSEKNRSQMPSLFCAIGSETASLQDHEIRGHVNTFLDALGPVDEVCLVPPDFTRFHSQAGKITQMITEYYYGSTTNHAKTDAAATAAIPKIQIMPALGTHTPMTKEQIQSMQNFLKYVAGENQTIYDAEKFLNFETTVILFVLVFRHIN